MCSNSAIFRQFWRYKSGFENLKTRRLRHLMFKLEYSNNCCHEKNAAWIVNEFPCLLGHPVAKNCIGISSNKKSTTNYMKKWREVYPMGEGGDFSHVQGSVFLTRFCPPELIITPLPGLIFVNTPQLLTLQ